MGQLIVLLELSQKIASLHLDFDWLQQLEAHGRFGRQRQVFVSREGCACRAGAAAGESADGCSLAPSGERANESTCACAAANHICRALALAFLGSSVSAGINFIVFAADSDGIQNNLQT